MTSKDPKYPSSPKKGSEITLKIESAAFKGKGVGHLNGMAVFVPNTAPGDLIRTRIIKRKKKYCEGKLLEILEPSDMRIEPKCRHALVCGGCTWQQLPYKVQLNIKRQQVADHMQRIAELNNPEVNDTVAADNPFYYRNKMEYSFGTRRWLSREEINREEFVSDKGTWAGLHAPGRFDKILNLQECHLQIPVSYEILNFVREYARQNSIKAFDTINKTGFFRNVVIRNAHHTDDLMVNIVTYQDDPHVMGDLTERLIHEFPDITTIVNNINDRPSPTAIGRYEHIMHGPGYIVDSIGSYTFKIEANAFFQTNTAQAENLYHIATEYADIQPHNLVFDLYCGVGTLSLFVSKKAGKVVGIELNEVALENARHNAAENGVENTDFIAGDMKDTFSDTLIEKFGRPDCIITDPPRSGMHPDVVDSLNELTVPTLIYISCNSSTMARDLKILKKKYVIEEIQPVDMFPQTYHIETVAKLRSK